MTPEAWLFHRSFRATREDPAKLRGCGLKLGVCVLARNAAATLGRHLLLLQHGWPGGTAPWHEIFVADLGSTDATAEIAREHGAVLSEPADRLVATVESAADGDGLARVLALTESDLLLVVPADLLRVEFGVAASLLAALVQDPCLHLCLSASEPDGGPLATLGTRPVLAALVPELAVVSDPTSPLFALRTSAIRELPLARTGGFECALVAECHLRHGIASIGQVRAPSFEWSDRDPRLDPGRSFRSTLALLETLRASGRISTPRELGHLLPQPRDWADDGPRIVTSLEIFPWERRGDASGPRTAAPKPN
jgi:glucosyl-3-phosphoglycerate synthase